jgi:hypothetical protein
LSYESESADLDDTILNAIEGWRTGSNWLDDDGFNSLALRLFDYQRRYNEPYARYCSALGVANDAMPASWEQIPPVPAAAFKEATLTTFPAERAVLAFETSGTTQGRPGKHFFETPRLYDAALIAGFERFMLADGARLRYCNLLANPATRPESSLGYMMGRVSQTFGEVDAGWYVDRDALDFEHFVADVRDARARERAVCIATTAFALVAVLDRCAQSGIDLPLAPGSRIMETGGFKGRSRIVERDELYRRAAATFSIAEHAIVAEYGMTELTSQYYDAARPQFVESDSAVRFKRSPPWLRPRVVGPDGATLPDGVVGALVHVDLANRASCIAVATEDLGVRFADPAGPDSALVIIGRERGAELRGCSLDAETLRDVRA